MAAQSTPQVNLIREHAREVRKQRLLSAKVQFYAGGALIVYLAVLFAVLGVRGALALKINRTEKAISEEEFALARLQPIEAKYLLIHNKFTLVNDIISEQKDVRQILTVLAGSLTDQVEVETVAYSEAAGSLEVSLLAQDVFAANEWLDILEREVGEEVYQKIQVGGVSRAEDGIYAMSLTYQLTI